MSIATTEFKIVKVEEYGYLARKGNEKPKLFEGSESIDSIATAFTKKKEQQEEHREDGPHPKEESHPEEQEKDEEEHIAPRPFRGVGKVIDTVNGRDLFQYPFDDLVEFLKKDENTPARNRESCIFELKQSLMPKHDYKHSSVNSLLSHYLESIEKQYALYRTIKKKHGKQQTYYWIVEGEEPVQDKGDFINSVKGEDIYQEPYMDLIKTFQDNGDFEYTDYLNLLRKYYKVRLPRLKKIEKAYRKHLWSTGTKVYIRGDEKHKEKVIVTMESGDDGVNHD